jgi:hypothetical protein
MDLLEHLNPVRDGIELYKSTVNKLAMLEFEHIPIEEGWLKEVGLRSVAHPRHCWNLSSRTLFLCWISMNSYNRS